MKNANSGTKKYKYIIIGTFSGIIVSFIFLLIMAAIFTYCDMVTSLAHPMASIASGVGALAGGFITAKLCKTNGLLNGLFTGVIMFVIIMLVSLIISDSSVTLMTFIRLIIIMCSSAIGGILGVNKLSKKHFI